MERVLLEAERRAAHGVGSPLYVLVVDDKHAECRALQGLLRSFDVASLAARSVLEAQLILVRAQRPFDAIFIAEDVRNSDVRQFCRSLQDHPAWSRMPIVVVASCGPDAGLANPFPYASVMRRPVDGAVCAATVARLRAGDADRRECVVAPD